MKQYLYLSIFFFMMLLPASGYGQIVTPSLDPGLVSESPSAVSWRFGSTFGMETAFGNQKDEETKTRKIGSYPNSGYGGVIAIQPSHVTGELSYKADEIRYDPVYSIDSNGETSFVLQKVNASYGRFQLAIRGENKYSVGVGLYRLTEEIGDQTVDKSSYTGSFGFRFLDNLFMSAGLEQGQTDAEGFDRLKWQIFFSGVAVQMGDPTSNMMRLEGSIKTSPKESTENSDKQTYNHKRFQEYQGSFELLWSEFLFSAMYKKKDTESAQDEIKDSSHEKTRFGLGYRTIGVSIMLYGSRSIDRCDETENETDEIQLTFSYSYI